MAFFKSKPGLPDHEKARIEFHLQQISECIGFERLKRPVLSEESVLFQNGQLKSAEQIAFLLGDHLEHDVSDISIQTTPLPPEKCGGGG